MQGHYQAQDFAAHTLVVKPDEDRLGKHEHLAPMVDRPGVEGSHKDEEEAEAHRPPKLVPEHLLGVLVPLLLDQVQTRALPAPMPTPSSLTTTCNTATLNPKP